jgi:hypothetical protein
VFVLKTIWLTAKGAAGLSGVIAVVGGELFADLVQPFVQLGRRAGVQRREGAHDAGLALGDDQSGLEMMNSGAPTTGRRRRLKIAGRAMGTV